MNQSKKNNNPNCIYKTWWTVKYAVQSWFEWQDAKYWADAYHPAWVTMATKCCNRATRQYYKLKILNSYQEMCDALKF